MMQLRRGFIRLKGGARTHTHTHAHSLSIKKGRGGGGGGAQLLLCGPKRIRILKLIVGRGVER